jgi:hypothetical protein
MRAERFAPMLAWYQQLEKDLELLERRLNRQMLISCYRDALRDEYSFVSTLYEIHGAALLSAEATAVYLHVPLGTNRKNFDVRVRILRHVINADCKTRKDDFPFNIRRREGGADGITGHYGARATIDPHDAENLGLESRQPAGDVDFRPIPESTVIRQILSETRSQLPENGRNLILFGQVEGDRMHLERALYGAEIGVIERNLETKEVRFGWSLSATGAFGAGLEGEPFQWLSGILWYRLWKLADTFGRAYELYLNPNALIPIPSKVVSKLKQTMESWQTELRLG